MSKLNNRAINIDQASQMTDRLAVAKEIEAQSIASSIVLASHRSSLLDQAPDPIWKTFVDPCSWRKDAERKQLFAERSISTAPYCALRRKTKVTQGPAQKLSNQKSGPLHSLLPLKTNYSRNHLLHKYQTQARASIDDLHAVRAKGGALLIGDAKTNPLLATSPLKSRRKTTALPNSSRVARAEARMVEQAAHENGLRKLAKSCTRVPGGDVS